MRETLRRYRPIVFFEFSPGALREVSRVDGRDVLSDFRALGYDLWLNPTLGQPATAPQSDAEILAAVPGDTPAEHVDLITRPRAY